MNHKKPPVVSSGQDSWASSVSDYILKRREQTVRAYTKSKPTQSKPTQSNPTQSNADLPHYSNQVNPNSDAWLFKAMFIVLAERLEEGHTVFTLSSAYNDKDDASLFIWQQQLLNVLALPLFDLIEDITPITEEEAYKDIESNEEQIKLADGSNVLLAHLQLLFSQGARLWTQLNSSNHERHLLHERYDLVKQLYDLFIDINQTQDSFDAFIQRIKSNPLMTAMVANNDLEKNSLSNGLQNNKHNPIIYKVINHSNDPLHSLNITFWLHRAWQAEHTLTKRITTILSYKVNPLPLEIPETLNKQQVNAINIANSHALSIITGGPGTGKTYTVAQLVIALHQADEQDDNKGGQRPVKFSTDSASLTLAAPTGKAAQRMQESLQAALNDADVDIKLEDAKTIHRLLGIGRDGQPRYNADNPLGEDVIIVDEASMLGVELANYLVSSVKKGARLILLGDANQLAAVDAGAVLADLRRIPLLQPVHAVLTESRRFDKDSGIGKLAALINQKNSINQKGSSTDTAATINAMWQLLKEDAALSFKHVESKNNNSLSDRRLLDDISANYQPFLTQVKTRLINLNALKKQTQNSYEDTDNVTVASELIDTLNTFRVLTAGHHGQWGDNEINRYLSNWHITQLKLPLGKSPWYHGRPVMILHNSYELGLFNGDIGICLQVASSNKLEVFFENKTQGIAVNLLNDDLITTAYAMTIHKSQGSEFDHVTITFDSSHSRLLSKELIYTAVTRAKKQVTIYSTRYALEQAVTTPTVRQTGLALQFMDL